MSTSGFFPTWWPMPLSVFAVSRLVAGRPPLSRIRPMDKRAIRVPVGRALLLYGAAPNGRMNRKVAQTKSERHFRACRPRARSRDPFERQAWARIKTSQRWQVGHWGWWFGKSGFCRSFYLVDDGVKRFGRCRQAPGFDATKAHYSAQSNPKMQSSLFFWTILHMYVPWHDVNSSLSMTLYTTGRQ